MYDITLTELLGESKAKKILWFPITSNPDEEYCSVLKHRLDMYVKKLEENKKRIFSDGQAIEPFFLNGNGSNSINNDQMVSYTKTLVNGIEQCHKAYCDGNVNEAYFNLFDAFNKINLGSLLETSGFIKKLERNHVYYRIRKCKKTEEKEDFYHISFKKTHLCKDDRYNIKGYPCLYLSHSREGSIAEMGYSKSEDSIASFNLKKESQRRLLDLTLDNKNLNKDTAKEMNQKIVIHILWPLIAACKGISRYCKANECECSVQPKHFKIEYVIPQMLAEYVHFRLKLNGIIYFTVRKEDFDTAESNLKNYILFTKASGGSKEYDMDLLNEFEINVEK